MKGVIPDKPLLPVTPSALQPKSVESWKERWDAAFGKRRFAIADTSKEVESTDVRQ